jgi:hypothetical protein
MFFCHNDQCYRLPKYWPFLVNHLVCVKLTHIISSTCFDRPQEEWLVVDVGVWMVKRIKNYWSYIMLTKMIPPDDDHEGCRNMLRIWCVSAYQTQAFCWKISWHWVVNVPALVCWTQWGVDCWPERGKQQEVEINAHIVKCVIATPCQI